MLLIFKGVEQLYQLDAFTEKYYAHVLNPDVQKEIFQTHFPNVEIDRLFTPIKHHHAHAASTFYPSHLDDALVIVADGLGEVDSISVYHGSQGSLVCLRHYDLFSSLGMFYSMITYHLGFEPNNDEYKVMGLAPYGDPNRFKFFFEKCIELKPMGEIHIPVFHKNKSVSEKQTYKGLRDWFNLTLIPARQSQDEIIQIHKDIAAGLQKILNKAILHVATYWKQQTSTKNLCLAGGVALNCTANGVLASKGSLEACPEVWPLAHLPSASAHSVPNPYRVR